MRYLFILLALLCVSCGTAVPSIKPYKLDIQQGNVVTSKMLLQLRPGMTKSQVRFIMGTPLIQDSFHRNRWDYFYQMREGGKVIEQRRVILEFENELLKKVRGDVIPAGTDPLKAGESQENTGTRVIAPEKKPKEKGVLDKLKFWEKDEDQLAKEAAEKETAAKEAAAREAEAKAQQEAEAAASKTAAEVKETPVKEAPAPVEEEAPKSMLAIPLELPRSVEPVASTPSPAAPAADVVQPAPAAEAAAPQEPAADVAQPPVESVSVEPAPVAVQPESPANPQSYESASGMVFDKRLRFGLQELEPEAAPTPVSARAGNKVPPEPKDLPEESSPSFFDRMLEKIGF